MYFRKKASGGRAYLQIVESGRDGAQARQQVIATLDRIEDLRDSGQLERLLRSGARFAAKATIAHVERAGGADRRCHLRSWLIKSRRHHRAAMRQFCWGRNWPPRETARFAPPWRHCPYAVVALFIDEPDNDIQRKAKLGYGEAENISPFPPR
jgi:hypothetical protein